MPGLLDFLDNIGTSAGEVKGLLGGMLQELAARAQQGLLDSRAALKNPKDPAAVDAAINNTMNAGGLLAMPTVYHGTPHQFNRYDLSKIGTGEGAQAYGHGIYFAENPAVAGDYQHKLGGTQVGSVNSKTMKYGQDEARAMSLVEFHRRIDAADPLEAAIKDAPKTYPKDAEGTINILRTWQREGQQVKSGGQLYKQDLPDSVLPRMLQWDKPLSEQPAPVKRALSSDPVAREVHDMTGIASGKQIVQQLENTMGPGKAQEYLRSLGIPGLSYLDAGSRAGGKGTMNHVIWDQGLLDQMTPKPYKP